MRYSSQVKPISYLKANAAEVLYQINEDRQPMVITQNGEAKAVLQDVVSFEATFCFSIWNPASDHLDRIGQNGTYVSEHGESVTADQGPVL